MATLSRNLFLQNLEILSLTTQKVYLVSILMEMEKKVLISPVLMNYKNFNPMDLPPLMKTIQTRLTFIQMLILVIFISLPLILLTTNQNQLILTAQTSALIHNMATSQLLQKLQIFHLSPNILALMSFSLMTNIMTNSLASSLMNLVIIQKISVLLIVRKQPMMQKIYSGLTLMMMAYRDVMFRQLILPLLLQILASLHQMVLPIPKIYTQIFTLENYSSPTHLILPVSSLSTTEMGLALFHKMDKLLLIQNKIVMVIFNFFLIEKLEALLPTSPRW